MSESASAPRASSSKRLEPLRNIDAGPLNIAYYEAGPAGPAVMLMHGFPYDIHSYVDVAPILAAQGCRVLVPYLRGYGPTRFREEATPRSGEQAAMGADMMALMNALGIQRAVFAGYDWGGRAACVGAALWPERCIGLVCVNSYLIQDIARAMVPARPDREVPLWYQYYFQLERGRAGLTSSANWRHSLQYRCRRSRWTGTAMASARQPTAAGARRNLRVPASIAWCRAPDIICRRKSPRPLPLASWT
ncbi:alpha/beta hydrolase [Bradyrhizobium sp. 150]|uniref:alpha/beta fold hydrolase n=1 Tax=Bradyrhizobium sp. 150 TaxID=2782625 RepID=UPI0031F61F09